MDFLNNQCQFRNSMYAYKASAVGLGVILFNMLCLLTATGGKGEITNVKRSTSINLQSPFGAQLTGEGAAREGSVQHLQ